MQNSLAVQLSHHSVGVVHKHMERIRPLVRSESLTLLTACRSAGLPMELAEVCSGLLATVVDDLVQVGRMARTDFERTKRLQRILTCAEEPAVSALRLAMAASPLNGRAAVAHWDVVCEPRDRGRLGWLLRANTESAYRYGRGVEKRS
jgi:hypothetical protein